MHIVGCIYSSISNLYIHSSIYILYMYVCMLYVCMNMCVCVYIFLSFCLSSLYIYICMYVCMHAFMYVCMHVCMYVYIYTYIYIYTGRPEVGAYPAVLAQLLAAASRADNLAGARWGGLDVTATR
jgi:hypothetical protein